MDEQKIQKLMKQLDISRNEAIELIVSDNEVDRMKSNKEINSDLTVEQKKAIKKLKNTGVKTVNAYGKTQTVHRKEDADKNAIMEILIGALGEIPTERTKTGEFTFQYNSRQFKVVLSAPRGKNKPKS